MIISILNNSKAMLNFNRDNKATSYKQSIVDDIKPTDGADKKHQVIGVEKSNQALYYNRYLKGRIGINARLGYYSVVNRADIQCYNQTGKLK